MKYLFTSESVSEGHPDKVSDQISDAILDEFLRQDAEAKVACETFCTTGQVIVGGEVKAEHYARIQALAAEFEKKHGSIVCRELLGLSAKHDLPDPTPRTPDFYTKRPCGEIIGDAAEILDRFLEENYHAN